MSAMQLDADGDFVLRHHRLPLCFGVACGASAVFGNQNIVEIHFHEVGIEVGNVGITDGGEQPAEVGVGGEKGGFDQWRTCRGVGGLAGFVAGFGVFDADGDELGRALAVADDGLGEFERKAAQQFFELGVTRVGDVVDFALAVLPVAMMTKLSLVLVSPSTVMVLKVSSAISCVISWRTGWETLASVAMKPSMVAILG